MVRRPRVRRASALLAAIALVVSATPIADAGPSRGSAAPGHVVHGAPGVAVTHVVLDLADRAAHPLHRGPISPRAAPAPRALPQGPGSPPAAETAVEATPAATPRTGATPSAPSPGLADNFQALPDAGVTVPPDTSGAVGPSHLMVMLNDRVRVQSRAGGNLLTVALFDFWASLGPSEVFDPRVLYDPSGNRWISVAMADSSGADSAVFVGSSRTSDPTGLWDLYRIDADATDLHWADFPSVGFNARWIVVQANMFPFGAGDETSFIFVLDKADLYAAGAGDYTLFEEPYAYAAAPARAYDAGTSTMYLVQRWNGNAGGTGYLRLSTITGNVGSEVLSAGVAFPSTTAEWAMDGGTDFAPQAGRAEGIHVNDDRMADCVYRNGAIWCVHTVFLPASGPTRSAIQWWELSPTGVVLQRGRIDDATGAIFRAYPSIAVNRQGDALIGYSRFSEATYAGAAYSFRAAADAAGTMRSPVMLKAGLGPYYKTLGGAENRWGDYSATVVDPLNDRDLWTIQEYAASGNKWGTWWGKIAPAAAPADTAAPAPVAPVQAPAVGRQVSPGTVPVNLRWYARDDRSGIASYQLQQKVDSGGWAAVSLPSAAANSIVRTLYTSHSYTYRVSATDGAANASALVAGPAIRPGIVQESSSAVVYSSGWTSAAVSGALGGSLRYATVAGKEAFYAFTGRGIGWVSTRATNRGKADVYVDGGFVTTVDLGAAATQQRTVVFSYAWASSGSHSIDIVVLGTAGRPRVDVDAFVRIE